MLLTRYNTVNTHLETVHSMFTLYDTVHKHFYNVHTHLYIVHMLLTRYNTVHTHTLKQFIQCSQFTNTLT